MVGEGIRRTRRFPLSGSIHQYLYEPSRRTQASDYMAIPRTPPGREDRGHRSNDMEEQGAHGGQDPEVTSVSTVPHTSPSLPTSRIQFADHLATAFIDDDLSLLPVDLNVETFREDPHDTQYLRNSTAVPNGNNGSFGSVSDMDAAIVSAIPGFSGGEPDPPPTYSTAMLNASRHVSLADLMSTEPTASGYRPSLTFVRSSPAATTAISDQEIRERLLSYRNSVSQSLPSSRESQPQIAGTSTGRHDTAQSAPVSQSRIMPALAQAWDAPAAGPAAQSSGLSLLRAQSAVQRNQQVYRTTAGSYIPPAVSHQAGGRGLGSGFAYQSVRPRHVVPEDVSREQPPPYTPVTERRAPVMAAPIPRMERLPDEDYHTERRFAPVEDQRNNRSSYLGGPVNIGRDREDRNNSHSANFYRQQGQRENPQYGHVFDQAPNMWQAMHQGHAAGHPVFPAPPAYAPQWNPMFRSISHAVPPFDGSPSASVESWIMLFHNMTELLSEPEKFFLLSEKLTGRASIWFQDQQMNRTMGRGAPIYMWLQRLQLHFAQSHTMRRSGVTSRKQQRGESAQVFASDLQHLLMIYNPVMDINEQIQYLQSQMHPDYAAAFAIRCPEDASWTRAVEALASAMEFTKQFGALSSGKQDTQSLTTYTTERKSMSKVPEEKLEKLVTDLDTRLKHLTLADKRQVSFQNKDRDKTWSRERGRDRDRTPDRRAGYERRVSRSPSGERNNDSGSRYRYRRSSTDRPPTPANRNRSPAPTRDRSRDRSPGGSLTCWNCGGKGHTKYECPSPKDIGSDSSRSGNSGN